MTLARRLPIFGKPRCGVRRSAGCPEWEYAYATAGWRTECVTLARRLPIFGKPRCGVRQSAGCPEWEYAYATAGWRTELYSNVSVPQADVFVGCHMRHLKTQNNNYNK